MNPDGTSPRSAVDSMGISKVLSPAAITNSGFSFSLSRSTAVLAAVFFITSLSLAYIASNKPKTSGGVMQNAVQSQPVTAPSSLGIEKAGSAVDPASKAKEIPK